MQEHHRISGQEWLHAVFQTLFRLLEAKSIFAGIQRLEPLHSSRFVEIFGRLFVVASLIFSEFGLVQRLLNFSQQASNFKILNLSALIIIARPLFLIDFVS